MCEFHNQHLVEVSVGMDLEEGISESLLFNDLVAGNCSLEVLDMISKS